MQKNLQRMTGIAVSPVAAVVNDFKVANFLKLGNLV